MLLNLEVAEDVNVFKIQLAELQNQNQQREAEVFRLLSERSTDPNPSNIITTSNHSEPSNEQELRDRILELTKQYEQLEESNNSWLSYQYNQIENYKNVFRTILTDQHYDSLETIAQQINQHLDQLLAERRTLSQRVEMLEALNNDLLSGEQKN